MIVPQDKGDQLEVAACPSVVSGPVGHSLKSFPHVALDCSGGGLLGSFQLTGGSSGSGSQLGLVEGIDESPVEVSL